MKKRLSRMVLLLVLLSTCISASLLFGQSTSAYNFNLLTGIESARGEGQPTDLMGDTGIVKRMIDMMLFAVGALSVMMLVVGGMSYVVSGGKKESITKAKNTILYAIIGLVIALLAYSIVQFILEAFAASGGYAGTDL